MILQKPFTLSQPDVDTSGEIEIATSIQPGISLAAWRLLAIEFTLRPDVLKAWAAADSDFTLQMTKRELSPSIQRIVTYADQDLLLSFNQAVIASGTPANITVRDATFYINLPDGVIVYSESIFMQLITTGTGQQNSLWGRLLYEGVTLSQSEAFTIIATRP